MKTLPRMRFPYFCAVCLLLGLGFAAQEIYSQDASALQQPIKLSGSEQTTVNMVLKCDVIFIGKVEEIGMPGLKSAGQSTYHGVRVRVSQLLKGSIDSPVLVSLRVTIGKRLQEVPPQIGKSYVFFVEKRPSENIARKLLDGTDVNIAKIKQLIATPPIGNANTFSADSRA
ncbi:MAG TPA: hypothetical protein VNU49_05665 [Opitutaceae bacterium]|nr:hypothetical protein [Opitutaceae bacterium]